MEPSEDLKRFKDSLNLSHGQWRDGKGYDLEALARLEGSERVEAESILLARNSADWRDMAALDALGTDKALEELTRALSSKRIEVRLEAAERLFISGKIEVEVLEDLIIQSLDEAAFFNGMTKVLRLVEQYPSPRVRAKIRLLTVEGNHDIRVLAAGMHHFLGGGTDNSFEWKHRPLYLRFGQGNKEERRLALQELDALIKQTNEPR